MVCAGRLWVVRVRVAARRECYGKVGARGEGSPMCRVTAKMQSQNLASTFDHCGTGDSPPVARLCTITLKTKTRPWCVPKSEIHVFPRMGGFAAVPTTQLWTKMPYSTTSKALSTVRLWRCRRCLWNTSTSPELTRPQGQR